MDYEKSSNIQDRLAHLWFKPSEFVHVINIDDEPFIWEFCTEEDISVSQGGLTATRNAKIEKFSLEPGQTTEMPGNIALVFIEKLVKHLIQKEGKSKMMNVVPTQDAWIERIFLGKKGLDLPYASGRVDPDTHSKSYKAAEMVKDPLDPFAGPLEETAFPDVTAEPVEKKRGRPAKVQS